MTMQQQAWDLAEQTIGQLRGALRDEIARRNNHPCRQALYHQNMVRIISDRLKAGRRVFLGRWRMSRHRSLRDRWTAKCDAKRECGLGVGC